MTTTPNIFVKRLTDKKKWACNRKATSQLERQQDKELFDKEYDRIFGEKVMWWMKQEGNGQ